MAEEKTKKPTKAEQENEQLRQQMAEMQKMIEEMQSRLGTQPTVVEGKKDRSITFINLTSGQLVLKGTHIYTIDKQFGKRQFTEREAMVILSNMPQTISNGMVYIADAQFVADNDLTDAYRTMLTDKQLKTLLDKDASIVVDTYNNVSDVQKSIIIDMIVDKREHEQFVDNNVLVELGKLCGRDLVNITPLETDKR
ncbi:MAG: hypothetical protein KBT06_00640 [Prevotellaceae bacterium]|nr:hypothetical protein [Candidatus Colivivens equi]